MRRTLKPLPLTGLLVIAAFTAKTAHAETTGSHQGMVISCPMYGKVWGSSAMSQAIQEVKALGVNKIQIHPYARIHKDGRITFTPTSERAYLRRAVKIAEQNSVDLFWKPHLAYWGSFDWRGAITFSSEAEWQRFFRTYEAWILDHARFAQEHQIKLFAVGTELDKTIHRPEWSTLIKKVKAVYSGTLVYAANWDSYARVPFWREIDLIGIQAYFPLSSTNAAVTRASLDAQWKRIYSELETFSKTHKRKILFTELGYTRSTLAASEPWASKNHGPKDEALALQKMLLTTALETIKRHDFVIGAYLWKWMPGFAPWERDFSMRDKDVRNAIQKVWK